MNKTDTFVDDRVDDVLVSVMIVTLFFLSPLWLPVYIVKRWYR